MQAETWDVIVVGAGSAGCALAARLTESGAHRVLLIEAGDDDRWMWLSIPTGVAKIMLGERAIWRLYSQVFGKQALYDPENGQLLSGSFMDYAMPRADIVCEPRLVACPVPTQANPLGAKGVGEAGTTGSLPALMNAVLDALRSQGVKHFDMPATPARIWRALGGK